MWHVGDFDKYDWGDPYEEFLKVGFFSREVSVPFCNGQLHGYFGGAGVPDEFWRLYAVYTAMAALGSIVWALRRTPDEVMEMVDLSNSVVRDHDGFQSAVPTWFHP